MPKVKLCQGPNQYRSGKEVTVEFKTLYCLGRVQKPEKVSRCSNFVQDKTKWASNLIQTYFLAHFQS